MVCLDWCLMECSTGNFKGTSVGCTTGCSMGWSMGCIAIKFWDKAMNLIATSQAFEIVRWSPDFPPIPVLRHRQINRVVKVKHQMSAGHRQATAQRPPDSLCGWPKFRPMPRRRSAGGPVVTAGGPAGRSRMPRNPPIIGRSPFGNRAAIEGFDTDVIWPWTFNICMIIVIVHNFYC